MDTGTTGTYESAGQISHYSGDEVLTWWLRLLCSHMENHKQYREDGKR